jgi:phosphinothricin acetyltransferase
MINIRPATRDDFAAIHRIYQEGIDTREATFQTRAKTQDEWEASVLELCQLVAVLGGRVVGWAALSAVSTRWVYRGVAEVSVYVASENWGQGVGFALLSHLVTCSERHGFWTLQASIFPENKASLHIHTKCGFRVVGTREKIGQQNGVWRDTVFLERRSKVVGWK